MIPKNGLDIARLRLTVRSSTNGTKSGKRTTSLFLEDVVPQHERVEPREEEAVQGIVGGHDYRLAADVERRVDHDRDPGDLIEPVDQPFVCSVGGVDALQAPRPVHVHHRRYDVPHLRRDRRDVIPAVVHVDGTGRLQSIDAANATYKRLIDRFNQITGVPVVVNTSFNIRGEPIVMTPDDALNCFFFTGLDTLVLGDYVLENCLLYTSPS